LFTESTLTAMLPFLVKRDRKTFAAVLRFWGIVLVANLTGTTLFALLIVQDGLFPSVVRDALVHFARESTSGEFVATLVRAILSGWLIALMAWLLPSARSARFFVIVFLTYVVALGGFTHIVAGSVEAAYSVFSGNASLLQYCAHFLVPTLIGNTIGGVALVAMLNHAPLADQLQKAGGGKPRTRTTR
jgi:formate/nitrite transporter FocA (FNT family)